MITERVKYFGTFRIRFAEYTNGRDVGRKVSILLVGIESIEYTDMSRVSEKKGPI